MEPQRVAYREELEGCSCTSKVVRDSCLPSASTSDSTARQAFLTGDLPFYEVAKLANIQVQQAHLDA